VLLRLVSRDVPSGNQACIQSINSVTVSGAQIGIVVSEQIQGSTINTPRHTFGPTTFFAAPAFPRYRCSPTELSSTGIDRFGEAGRGIDVVLVSGPNASPQRQIEAYQILNSLRLSPFTSAHPRPHVIPFGTPQGGIPGTITVAVLDATGRMDAAAPKANVLRGLGYAIAGTGNAPTTQIGNTVACRLPLTRQADALAKAVGAGTQVVATSHEPFANVDCIVTVGN
jgi:hypothetical protein